MVLTILRQISIVCTSLDTWVERDLYLYWMLLSVRSNLYHIIYIPLHKLFYAMQETSYESQLWVGWMIIIAKARQRWLLQWKEKVLHGEFLKKVANGGELIGKP